MASYIDQVSSLGPKVWFRFNETAGTPTNSGSLSTTASFNSLLLNEQTDVDGRATYFDGSTARIQLNSWPAFSLFDDKSFTIETWFKLSTQDTTNRTLFRFSGSNPVGNTLTVQAMNSADANSGKLYLNIVGLGEQVSDRSTYTTGTYFDNKWHHLVIAVNTTSLKMYVDSNLQFTKTLTTGTLNWDSYNSSGNLSRLIGASRSNTSENYSQYFKGWLDEFAIYGYELNAQQVLDNYNAGASVNFAVGINTASALLPTPAWSVETVIPASVMTASSLFVATLPSNFNYVDGIQKIISDLGPETWLKFDYVTDYSTTTPAYITNYGSGGSFTYTGGAYNDIYQIGPTQEPAIELQIGTSSNNITSTSSSLFTTELSDNNFSIGIWFKVPSGIDTSEKQIFAYAGPTNSPINLKINNKKLVYTIHTTTSNNTYTTTADITEDVWHLAVMKLDLAATTIKYYLDGTEVYSDTAVGGSRNTPTSFVLGKASGNGTDNGGKRLTLAHYFVDTYSDVTPTIITNLYNAGTRQNQAKAVMRQPGVKFLNKYDDTVQALNPLIQLGLNETTGTVVENIGSSTGGSFSLVGSNYTRGSSVPTKNRYGYNFTNKNTYVAGNYATATNTFSDNTKTVSVYAKINTVTGSDLQIIHFDGGSGGAYGIGLSLLANASGPQLAIIATSNPATWGTISAGTSYFGDWHLYTMVRDGSSVKLYVDGKQVGSTLTYSSYNLTDSGYTATGGGETVWFAASAATVNKYVDEVAIFDYALTNQQIFELWQSIEIDKGAANSELVMPTNIAGTGNTQSATAMTASGLIVDPTQTDEINIIPAHLEAFGQFVHPNYGGNVVIDANYGHSAFTADAYFHEPQFNIGEFNAAASLDASALMVHPTAIIAGAISVPTLVALDATLVMPGIVTIKGAKVFADTMRAQSLFPLPPAYIQLTDDPWFVRLYEAHSDRKTEPKQAVIAAGAESTEIIKGGFLSFFDDHLADRSLTSSPNTITSELPAYFFSPISSTGAVDTTKATTTAIAPRQSNSPTPLLAIAGQDNQERKAVRVNNIEFVLPGTSKNFSERYYNLEFSIKTTKSDQVLTYGQWESYQYYGSRIGVIGLSDGKLYLATDDSSPLGTGLADLRRNIPSTAPHPKNLTATNSFGYFQGRNNIADGNWHHVIIQYGWTDGRTQIWVDGELDRQIGVLNELGGTGYATFAGSDGTDEIRPYILGFNSNDPLLYSDFTISAWNFYPGRFLEQRDISLNYTAYGKWTPIKAEPMTATVGTPQNHRAGGNRARALMLYFWPVEREMGTSKSITSSDYGQFGALDEPTFETFLTNVNTIEYQGWDLFPVDVIGTRVSPMIKPEVWGGYGYRDQVTGAPRYLDLVNDIDLTQFDAIFFRNFPEQTEELDEYVRQEFSDTYFGVKEQDLYENFLKSLRAAVDQGLSLYITNSKLALDLGIVDRVEVISDITEAPFAPTSTYVTSQLPNGSVDTSGEYYDTHRNNRFRVVNTLDGLTNEESYIWRDWMYFQNDDQKDFGGPNKPYASVLHRPNGLQVGDTFVNASATLQPTVYEAVPFANVKAGKIITAFSNTIKTGSSETDNPYKNYATVIALEPGTILKGKATGGKIFVNFTERLAGSVSQISGSVSSGRRPIYRAREITGVDLNQDKWINLAYSQGQITEAKKNELLADPRNLDRRLETAIANGEPQSIIDDLNLQKYWDSNGFYILASKQLLSDTTGSGDLNPNSPGRQALVNRTKRSGDPGTAKVTTFTQWFTFEYSWTFPRLQVATVSMLTRGFRWLSDKIMDEGTVNRVQSMNNTNAVLPMPVVTADKDKRVYVQTMLAGAKIVHAPGYALTSVSNTTLPLFATADFGAFVKNITPDVMTGTALIKQPRISGIEEDEIVVYINHVDPILYLMEDVIK